VVAIVVGEQPPNHRQLPQPGHLVGRCPILIRDQPASICVSPSRSRRLVDALRVPIW
jgi:hypothetical protein